MSRRKIIIHALIKHKGALLSEEEKEHLHHVVTHGTVQKLDKPEVTQRLIKHGYLAHKIGGIAITPKGQMMAYIGRAE